MDVSSLSYMEIFGILTGIATLIGTVCALLVFLPRIRHWLSAGPTEGQARTSAAIVYKENEILMVRRRSIGEALTWYFPSGSVNGAEEPAVRATHEVADETGIQCRVEKKLGERVHPDTKVYMYYYACSYVAGDAANGDSDENSHVEWVPAGEVEKRISTDIFPPVKAFLGMLSRGR